MLRIQVARLPAVAAAAAATGSVSGSSGICQLCTAVAARSAQRQRQQPAAKRHLATLITHDGSSSSSRSGKRRDALQPVGSSTSSATAAKPQFRPPRGFVSAWSRANLSSTATAQLGKRGQEESLNSAQSSRFSAASTSTSTSTSTSISDSGREPGALPIDQVVAPVRQIKKVFLAQGGIPTEESTLAALRTCEIAAGLLRKFDDPLPLIVEEPETGTSASALLSLDSALRPSSAASAGRAEGQVTAVGNSSPQPLHEHGRGPQTAQGSSRPSRSSDPARPRVRPSPSAAAQIGSAIDEVSEAVYAIVSQPTVKITPKVLERYVATQSRLGRPQSLPEVLSMFASKPVPRAAADGSIAFDEPSPARPSSAVQSAVAEAALDAAIEAKDLDAAVAIVENTYATKAFARSKFLKKALLPVTFVAGFPGLIYVMATGLSRFQNTMDDSTATGIVFAGVAAYLGFTFAIGAVASGTFNDHMKRVTWTPGTPLTQRWAREEERAAFDRIACSFGFSEPTRFGEEEGGEFQALREFVLRRGMILDRVELMEGMW